MSAKFDYKLFDLEPRDITVYEIMLSMERAASIRSIAEAARLNRGTTFEVIKKLLRCGLVTSRYHGKRKYYSAEQPDVLKQVADQRYQHMGEELTRVDAYVNSLKHLNREETIGQFTQFYDGEEEIAALLNDVLQVVSREPSKTYRVVSSAELRNHLYRKFRNFTKQRIKRGITAHVIAVGQGGDEADLADRRWLSTEKAPACYIIIYGNKVAQISLSDFGVVQGVVVQNTGIATLQQLLFDALWKDL